METTELVLTFLLVLGVGVWLGMKISNAILTRVFKELLLDMGISESALQKYAREQGIEVAGVEPEIEETLTVEIRVEQHGDQLYAFRKEDDKFLGQASDREQLIERLKQDVLTGTVRYVVNEADGAELMKEQTK